MVENNFKKTKLDSAKVGIKMVICSRGPGSETICIKETDVIGEWDPLLRNKLKKEPVFEVEYGDEGPVVAIANNVEMKDIWKWLQSWVEKETDEEFPGEDKMLKQLCEDEKKRHDAYVSALLRAFIVYYESDGIHNGPGDDNWTSCNSWRDRDGQLSEALTEKQFELVLSCGLTIDELEKWDCCVMRRAVSDYSLEGKLVRKGW